MEDLALYLQPTQYIESEHPMVVDTARRAAGGADNPTEVARRLFYWVRDEVRYNPYQEFWNAEIFKASYTLEHRAGYCVQKAVLLAAMARALGVPARLGFADIRNHKTPLRMLETMGTNLYVIYRAVRSPCRHRGEHRRHFCSTRKWYLPTSSRSPFEATPLNLK